jgi:phthiocerol/phenolphthiocerol synthesis type-I polyketide synthase E
VWTPICAELTPDPCESAFIYCDGKFAMKTDDLSETASVAIIGMAGRFPGAGNVDQYWRNLRDGVESIRFLTDEEIQSLNSDVTHGGDSRHVRAFAMMDGYDMFDAAFFDISHREAEITDPQHRIFLECAWEALEMAGYNTEKYDKPVAVYGGATINTYLLYNLLPSTDIINSLEPIQINIGNGGDFLTTRVSYKLNLKGPSHLVQCACSTSLVAVHLACQSLLNRECDMALAGGVSINASQRAGYRYVEGGMTSPDGHCRAFDARAKGTIFGSGVGVVVLKRLTEAMSDRDTIYAVIRGSAVNNDGSLKVGYTAPSIKGQSGVIVEALAVAGVSADSIAYVEAHGTGTPIGDPVEITALTTAFRTMTDKKNYCAIGSVKTNIGHLDAAAGVASLIKTVLALQHKQMPPSLHYQKPNPQIDFDNSPFYVNQRLQTWPRTDTRRRAGVSSFGAGGTNVHVILEEAPESEASGESRAYQLIAVSAKTETALETMCRNLAQYLEGRPGERLADVAYTLLLGRKRMKHRKMVVCRDSQDVIILMKSNGPSQPYYACQGKENTRVIFMFPGQGSQYVDMGKGIYESESVFREQVDWCIGILNNELGIDLRRVLYPTAGMELEAQATLDQTRISQPALFMIEYALAKQLENWGIKADAMIGHSLGEYVAACLAGVMEVEDALKLICKRGELMQEVVAGSMLAAIMSEVEAEEAIGNSGLSIAAVNNPRQIVISGDQAEIDRLADKLMNEGVVTKKLKAKHAFHSKSFNEAAMRLVNEVRKVKLRNGKLPYISNVTGKIARVEEMTDANYWGRQMIECVRFGDGIEELTRRRNVALLEVGPGNTLSKLARGRAEDADRRSVITLMRNQGDLVNDSERLTTAIGRLWLAGVELDWNRYFEGENRKRVRLPTYPFERKRYWIDARARGEGRGDDTRGGDRNGVNFTEYEIEAKAIGGPHSSYSRPALQQPYVVPTTERGQAIAAIWSRALGVDEVGIDDNFFELGGDSLIAIQVVTQLREMFKVNLPIAGLYERLTIRSLDEWIGSLIGEIVLPDVAGSRAVIRRERVGKRKEYQAKRRLDRKS